MGMWRQRGFAGLLLSALPSAPEFPASVDQGKPGGPPCQERAAPPPGRQLQHEVAFPRAGPPCHPLTPPTRNPAKPSKA